MGLLTELKGADGTREVDIDNAEKSVASGGILPPGIHHAVLEGVRTVEIEGEKRGYELTFKAIAGPGKDATVEDVLWLPKGEDEEKDKKACNRMTLFGHRLGCLKKVKDQKTGKDVTVEVEGKSEFIDVIGAVCFVNVKNEEREWEKKGKKGKVLEAKFQWEGLISPDDKRIKDVPLGKVSANGTAKNGTANGSSNGAGGGAGKKQPVVAGAGKNSVYDDL